MTKEPYPGYIECCRRWDKIRATCCLPGWLDHIKTQPSFANELRDLRASIERERYAADWVVRWLGDTSSR
jgi:hypothetical protein